MKYKRKFLKQILSSFTLLISGNNAYSCMSHSFSFIQLKDENQNEFREIKSIDEYFINKYKRQWEYADSSFYIKVPKNIESPVVVPVTIGNDSEIHIGRYKSIELYVVGYINILNSNKFSKEYLPKQYHVVDFSKNSPKAWNLKEITHQSKSIKKVANFKLGEHSIPYIVTRLRLLTAQQSKIVAVFIPKDINSKVKILTHANKLRTGPICGNVTYINGDWPKGLKSEYLYE